MNQDQMLLEQELKILKKEYQNISQAYSDNTCLIIIWRSFDFNSLLPIPIRKIFTTWNGFEKFFVSEWKNGGVEDFQIQFFVSND